MTLPSTLSNLLSIITPQSPHLKIINNNTYLNIVGKIELMPEKYLEWCFEHNKHSINVCHYGWSYGHDRNERAGSENHRETSEETYHSKFCPWSQNKKVMEIRFESWFCLLGPCSFHWREECGPKVSIVRVSLNGQWIEERNTSLDLITRHLWSQKRQFLWWGEQFIGEFRSEWFLRNWTQYGKLRVIN